MWAAAWRPRLDGRLQTRLPVQLQVRAVQEVGREDAGRRVRHQWRQARTPVSVARRSADPGSPVLHAAAAPVAHGDVQPVHAVEGGVAKVQPRRVVGEAQVGRVHGGRGMVQDAGRAQHLAVQVVDQRQATTVGLHAQQRRPRGALQEVLQAPAAAAGLSRTQLRGEGICEGGW